MCTFVACLLLLPLSLCKVPIIRQDNKQQHYCIPDYYISVCVYWICTPFPGSDSVIAIVILLSKRQLVGEFSNYNNANMIVWKKIYLQREI